jgi:hypothetical protein
METHTQKKGNSFATIITLFLFLATMGVTGYFVFQENAYKNAVAEMESTIETKKKSMLKLTDGLEFKEFMNTLFALDKAYSYRAKWALIAGSVLALENENIVFDSFSSTDEQKISITGTARTLNDLTALLTLLKENQENNIEVPFLNSLSKDISERGEKIYKFELTFDSLIS